MRYFVKTWYSVIADLVHTNKSNHALQKSYPDFKKVQGITYAQIPTYIQSVVKNLMWFM